MPIFEKVKYKKEREVNFCGLTLCHYGEKEYPLHKERYFELFPKKSYLASFLDLILSETNNEYDFVILCRVNAIGESYLLNYLHAEMAKQNKARKYCIVVHNRNYVPMFKMFSDVPVIYINLDKILLNAVLKKYCPI